jgi:2-polyprenyl-3-methyl-5-hydroxy-6-metoxy-1,4-benzoquinol methylase
MASTDQTELESRTSADLKHLYVAEYYTKHMAGATEFSEGRADLTTLANIRRAYALMLHPTPRAVSDLGAGRGELARHLLARGTNVTLVDYSEAAIQIARSHVGEDPRAKFVVADASALTEHVAPKSQDAVFMMDVVEHISTPELRKIFAACRNALRPGGVLCVHTPEKHYGSVITQSAVQGYHINLFEISDLRELLAESFETVDSFTWNGIERFEEPGRCIELFAVGHAGGPYPTTTLPMAETRAAGTGTPAWISATVANTVGLPPRFLLEANLHVHEAPADAMIQFVFNTSDSKRYFWVGLPVTNLVSNPAHIMLSSETSPPVGDARWEDVQRVVMRIRSPSGGMCDVRMSDLSLRSTSGFAGPSPSSAKPRRQPVALERTTLTSKLYDPRDYQKPAFAEMRRYFDSWWYVLALEKVKFSYSSRNRAWEYAQLITSVPFEEKQVLDLGTSGSLAPIYLVRMLGCSVVTFDLHWEEERRRLYEATGVADQIAVDVGNMHDPLPYEDDSFDIVTCWSVIEHLHDYSRAVSEMKRVCRDGGHILLTTDFGVNSATSPKSGVTFDRAGLEKLLAEFSLGFVGSADYDNVALDDPNNLAVKGEYTFASIALQN